MKTQSTTFSAVLAEWQKNWDSIITAWTQPPPVVDKARQAEQEVADQEWEDEGGGVKQPKKPVGEAPPVKLPL